MFLIVAILNYFIGCVGRTGCLYAGWKGVSWHCREVCRFDGEEGGVGSISGTLTVTPPSYLMMSVLTNHGTITDHPKKRYTPTLFSVRVLRGPFTHRTLCDRKSLSK